MSKCALLAKHQGQKRPFLTSQKWISRTSEIGASQKVKTTGQNQTGFEPFLTPFALHGNEVGSPERQRSDCRQPIILSVEDAPEWHFDRATLWNNIEAHETRKNSRTGRDVVLGLAWELEPEEQRKMVVEFAEREFVQRGHVVDIAFHRYGSRVRNTDKITHDATGEIVTGAEQITGWKEQGLPFLEAHQTTDVDMPHVKIERNKAGDITGHKRYQPHSHVLVSPRAWDHETGNWSKEKQRHFDHPATAMNWRYDWARLQNRHLADAGWDVNVSCTLEDGTLSDEGKENADIPARRTEPRPEAKHMDRREADPADLQIVERNKLHNEVMRKVVADQPQSEAEERTRRERLMHWWGNFRDRLPEHKAALREKAAHYVRLLGGRLRPEKTEHTEEPQETPDVSVQSVQLDERTHGHHWPQRGDHEPDPSA